MSWIRGTRFNGQPVLIHLANVLEVKPVDDGTGTVFTYIDGTRTQAEDEDFREELVMKTVIREPFEKVAEAIWPQVLNVKEGKA